MTNIQNETPKSWWQSTTILSDVFTGLAGIGIAIYAYSAHHDAGEAATAFAVFSAAAGVGVYGRVNATRPIA
jgi:hypothetical protein